MKSMGTGQSADIQKHMGKDDNDRIKNREAATPLPCSDGYV